MNSNFDKSQKPSNPIEERGKKLVADQAPLLEALNASGLTEAAKCALRAELGNLATQAAKDIANLKKTARVAELAAETQSPEQQQVSPVSPTVLADTKLSSLSVTPAQGGLPSELSDLMSEWSEKAPATLALVRQALDGGIRVELTEPSGEHYQIVRKFVGHEIVVATGFADEYARTAGKENSQALNLLLRTAARSGTEIPLTADLMYLAKSRTVSLRAVIELYRHIIWAIDPAFEADDAPPAFEVLGSLQYDRRNRAVSMLGNIFRRLDAEEKPERFLKRAQERVKKMVASRRGVDANTSLEEFYEDEGESLKS